ncbi:MAG: M28 family peptidase [Elusimicrobia bacterium]|nr:M28 family peptidase [Elusimicrobiota bacterium]
MKRYGSCLRLSLCLLLGGSPAMGAVVQSQTATQGVVPRLGGIPLWSGFGGLGSPQLGGSLLAPSLLSSIPFLPAPEVKVDAALAAPVVGAPVLRTAKALSSSQTAAPAEKAPASSFQGLESTDAAIKGSQNQGGEQAGQALDRLYEGGGRARTETADPVAGTEGHAPVLPAPGADSLGGAKAAPPAPAAPAAEKSGLEKFVDFAKSLFFPDGRPAGVVASRGSRSQLEGMATDEQMYQDMELSPLTYEERLAAVVELFKRGGAKPEEIITQDAGAGQKNIYVVKKGRTDRVIVVSSHHDKAEVGAGTIDNWTGTTMVTNLYQAMRDMETEATIVFMSFAREEDGLIGSARYLKSLTKDQRAKIDANVNLDTLAVDGTFSWQNNSTESLLEMVKKVASQEKLDHKPASLWGGDADSSSFRRYGIAAMTLFGVSPERIFDIVHSENDTMAVFSLPHYKNAFLLTLALLKFLNLTPAGPDRFVEPAAAVADYKRSAPAAV